MRIEILDNATGLVFAIAEKYIAGEIASVTLCQDSASKQFIQGCGALFETTKDVPPDEPIPFVLTDKARAAAELVLEAPPTLNETMTDIAELKKVGTPATKYVVATDPKTGETLELTTEELSAPPEGHDTFKPIDEPKPKKKPPTGGRGKKKKIIEPDPPEASPPPEPEALETPPVAEDRAQLKKELTKVFFQLLRSPNGKRAALEIGKKYNMGSNTNNVADDQVLDAIREVNERLNGHA